MARAEHLVALALARAALAGTPTAAGIAARLAACAGRTELWHGDWATRCGAWPETTWQRLDVRRLATAMRNDASWRRAWASDDLPRARRHILRVPSRLNPAPLGLHEVLRPMWPHSGALAQWLGLSTAALWRLTRPAAWQRGKPLADQHYAFRLMPKRRGGWRLLEVPEPYLMALQRRLLDGLLSAMPVHGAACGFVAGRSVLAHARAHAGQAVVLSFDLEDFFGSVRASRVQAIFETLGYPRAVARELTTLLTVATPEPVLQRWHESGGLPWPQRQRLRDAHLPQGAPSSPALANLAAFRLDLRLAGLAATLGARYTRYADDLVFSGPPHLRDVASRIERWVGRIALEEGFALNHRKTRCRGAAAQQRVAGVVVNTHANLPRDEFDRLKATLHRCATRGPAAANSEGIPDWRAHLQGRLAWARQVNPHKAERLVRWWQRIEWPGQAGPLHDSKD